MGNKNDSRERCKKNGASRASFQSYLHDFIPALFLYFSYWSSPSYFIACVDDKLRVRFYRDPCHPSILTASQGDLARFRRSQTCRASHALLDCGNIRYKQAGSDDPENGMFVDENEVHLRRDEAYVLAADPNPAVSLQANFAFRGPGGAGIWRCLSTRNISRRELRDDIMLTRICGYFHGLSR